MWFDRDYWIFEKLKNKKAAIFKTRVSAENSAQINRKFGVEFLGDSIANLYQSIDNISNFAWVYNEMF